jgi:hypothetical protein
MVPYPEVDSVLVTAEVAPHGVLSANQPVSCRQPSNAGAWVAQRGAVAQAMVP